MGSADRYWVSASIKSLLRRSSLGPLLARVRQHGPGFVWNLQWLERSQWSAPARLREFQDARIRDIVRHAGEHSAFYRERLAAAGLSSDQIRGAGDLASLPLLTRQDIRERFSAIKARNAHRFRPQRGSTGGTTGVPMEFLRDRNTSSIGGAARWRCWRWHGARFGHRFAEIRFLTRPRTDVDAVVRYYPGSRTLFINPMSASPQGLDTIVEHLTRFRPEVIRCGSPTWFAFLALHLLRRRQHAIRPNVVLVGGERVFPDQRQLIKEAFGVPAVELYGNWEYVASGGECERGRLHLDAEVSCVEVLKNGRRCAPGESGEIVATSLWNRSFPFIRYAIGDVGYFEADPCPCGRGLPTWRIIGGRQKDFLATADGYLFLPNSLLAEPRWRGKIDGIRFYQDTRHEVLAQVVRGPEFQDRDLAVLRENLEQLLGGRLRCSIEFCESLEQTVGGKHRFIVSKIPIEI